jgi:hypothetical protein
MTCVILGATGSLSRRHSEKSLVHLAELGLIPCWLEWWWVVVLAEHLLLEVQIRIVFLFRKLSLDCVRVCCRKVLHHLMDCALD